MGQIEYTRGAPRRQVRGAEGSRQGKDEKESGLERVACLGPHDEGRASELSHERGRTQAPHTMLVLPCLRAVPQTSTPPQGDTHPCLPGTGGFLGPGTFSQMQVGQPTLWLFWGTLLHPGLAPAARENLRWDTAGKKPLACIARGSCEAIRARASVASAPPALSPHKPLIAPPPSCCLRSSTSHSMPASHEPALNIPNTNDLRAFTLAAPFAWKSFPQTQPQ